MTSILEQEVTSLLASELGRAPTSTEIASGMIAPHTLAQIHNTLNVTQSILAVSPGDDLQSAINKLVLNGGGILFLNPGTYDLTDHLILYDNIHVQGVGSGGSIVDFGSLAKQIQITGTSLVPINSAFLQGLTVQNSSIELIKASYTNNFGGKDVQGLNGGAGFSIDNSTLLNWEIHTVDSCDVGLEMTLVSGFTINNAFMANITSGGAYVCDQCSNGVLINSSLDTVVGGGFVFTDSGNVGLDQLSILNVTGIGISLDGINGSFSVTNGLVDSSTSDGMKVQNSSTQIQVSTFQFSNNGGYGVNVSDAGSTKNLFVGNTFSSNSSGEFSDNGTDTLIRSNIGVADN